MHVQNNDVATQFRQVADRLAFEAPYPFSPRTAARDSMPLTNTLHHDAAASALRSIADTLRRALFRAGAQAVDIGGNLRRGKAEGVLHLVASAADFEPLVECLLAHAEACTRSRNTLHARVRVDAEMTDVALHLVTPSAHPVALLLRTGSRAHVRELKRRLLTKGVRLDTTGTRFTTEAQIYAAAGLPFIPPELREDRGEFEAAHKERLPALLDTGDVRGDLHCRPFPEAAPVERLLEAADERGYAYVALALDAAHDARALARLFDHIDTWNASTKGLRALKTLEALIDASGGVRVPRDLLNRADLVIGRLGDGGGCSQQQLTQRALLAMKRGDIDVFACPGALADDPPCAIDTERVLRAAADHDVLVELGAHGRGLDLSDLHHRMAGELGTQVVLGSRARDASALGRLDLAVMHARRGWLTKDDVANCQSLDRLHALLSGEAA